MTAIEGLKANCNVVVFDVNPLITFILDVFSTKFDESRLANVASKIVKKFQMITLYNCLDESHIYALYNKGAIAEQDKEELLNLLRNE